MRWDRVGKWAAAAFGIFLGVGIPSGLFGGNDSNGKSARDLRSRFKNLYSNNATGDGLTHTVSLATDEPMVMDGRGTALPVLSHAYPTFSPITITTWIFLYGPIPDNSTTALPASETTIVSFGRPSKRPLQSLSMVIPSSAAAASNTTDNTTMLKPKPITRLAPSLHVNVGSDEEHMGRVFFSGVSNADGRLTGFFSSKIIPVNEWVHIALVLDPQKPATWSSSTKNTNNSSTAASSSYVELVEKPGQAMLKGYINGGLQGRLSLDVDDMRAYEPEEEKEQQEKKEEQQNKGHFSKVKESTDQQQQQQQSEKEKEEKQQTEKEQQQQQSEKERKEKEKKEQRGKREKEKYYDTAVFMWGGSRRTMALMTGLLQHASIHFNQALTTEEIREVQKTHLPWPVLPELEAPLRLRVDSLDPPTSSSAAAAVEGRDGSTSYHSSSSSAKAEALRVGRGSKGLSYPEQGATWVQEAIDLLTEGQTATNITSITSGSSDSRGEDSKHELLTEGQTRTTRREEEDKRKQAHWFLMGAVLLEVGKERLDKAKEAEAILAALAAEEGMKKTNSSSISGSSSSNNSSTSNINTSSSTSNANEVDKSAVAAANHSSEKEGVRCNNTAVKAEDASISSSSSLPTSTKLISASASSAFVAQMILANQAMMKENRDREGMLESEYLHAYGRAVIDDDVEALSNLRSEADLLARRDSSPTTTTPSSACAIAAGHYLSLAHWVVDHYGEEVAFGNDGKGKAEGRKSIISSTSREQGGAGGGGGSMIVKPLEGSLIPEEEEVVIREGVKRKRGGGNGQRKRGTASSSSSTSKSTSTTSTSTKTATMGKYKYNNLGGIGADEMEYMRVRAEEGDDPDALVWYGQALYWGRSGLQANRAAAARMMNRAAEMGHPEAQYNAGIMALHGDGVGADPVRAEEMVGRAAEQGFAPALAAQGLWALQKLSSSDLYNTSHPQVQAAQALLQRAVEEGDNPEAHLALAGIEGWWALAGDVSTSSAAPPSPSSTNTTTSGSSSNRSSKRKASDDIRHSPEKAWRAAKHLAKAASGGHSRALYSLGATLWDPQLVLDLSEEPTTMKEKEKEMKGSRSSDGEEEERKLIVTGLGVGRDPLELRSLRQSCPAAIQLLRPVAEMTLAGIMKKAYESYLLSQHVVDEEEEGEEGVYWKQALDLYTLAAEAGVLSAQINVERLLAASSSSSFEQQAAAEGTTALQEEEKQQKQNAHQQQQQRQRRREQVALQGWGPAMRDLGRDKEKVGSSLEAAALYYMAGEMRKDSRALYDLASLLEGKMRRKVALKYYLRSMQLAQGAYKWPPALAYVILWGKVMLLQRLKHLKDLNAVANLIEELVMYAALALLLGVLQMMMARRRRAQDDARRGSRGSSSSSESSSSTAIRRRIDMMSSATDADVLVVEEDGRNGQEQPGRDGEGADLVIAGEEREKEEEQEEGREGEELMMEEAFNQAHTTTFPRRRAGLSGLRAIRRRRSVNGTTDNTDSVQQQEEEKIEE